MEFSDDTLTRDRFLGGKLQILQPKTGYRAGIDPVLLASFVPARPGQTVLELGCGAGVASLCLGHRNPGLDLTGIEVQPDYAALARRNAEENEIPMMVDCADISDLPAHLHASRFDHVIANPPYFRPGAGTSAHDGGRAVARAEDFTALKDWVDVAARRLGPRGRFTVIQRAERLGNLLAAMECQFGGTLVQALVPRTGRTANLVLVTAVRGGGTPLRIAWPVALHAGEKHVRDGDDYAPEIAAVLRDGAAFPAGNS